MTEYGHLAGSAAKAAASMKNASPRGVFAGVQDTVGAHAGKRSQNRPFASLGGAPGAARKTHEPAPGEALAIVRVDWGADSSQSASQPAVAETTRRYDVLDSEIENEAFDAGEAGLERGMAIQEVSKILGDPIMRTAGLAGRGYDEKALYQHAEGWRITVYASHGRVRDFTAFRDAEKSTQKFLPVSGSVIP
jgi:hypothetical protein